MTVGQRHSRKIHFYIYLLLENIMPVVRVSWFEGKETTAKKAVAKEITESMVRNFNFPRRNIHKVLAGLLRV
ncbi:tautomerase family protein [Pseudohongiella sp.]|jgi:hypothetical protein|nr:tautomerase family protein [Pseudohongiella sp.]HDZ09622.1 hypothetical protein [Pseudohongiella sp.]HEA61812.1 hypothetical protein [Pseudohongiella sp.]